MATMEDLKKAIEDSVVDTRQRVCKPMEAEIHAKIDALEAKVNRVAERMHDAILLSMNPKDAPPFPRFDGSDPRDWILRCLRFFRIYPHFDDRQKTAIASRHLDGKAEIWFQSLPPVDEEEEDGYMDWSDFVEIVLTRFDERDLFQDFKDLKQNSTLVKYREEFEAIVPLATYMIDGGVSRDKYILECFISGLREEFRATVRMFKPTDFHEAARIAQLQEANLLALANTLLPQPNTFYNHGA